MAEFPSLTSESALIFRFYHRTLGLPSASSWIPAPAKHACTHVMPPRSWVFRDLDFSTPPQWPRIADSGVVGGGATYFPLPVRYGFVHTDGREEIIEGTIAVGQLTATNEWIPSLMGWDLLQYFRLDMHGRNRTVSLDRV